jgi:hypothetical protein
MDIKNSGKEYLNLEMMKTKIGLIIAITAFNYNLVTGSGNLFALPDSPVELNTSSELLSAAPVTPKEATFDEEVTGYEINNNIILIVPTAPTEAFFEDNTPEVIINDYTLLAPSTPKEASFDNESDGLSQDDEALLQLLAPTVPSVADFNEMSADF